METDAIFVTETYVYLIKFQNSTKKYIVKHKGLAKLLDMHKNDSLEWIKTFDPSKEKFIKLSKQKCKDHFSFYTEIHLELKKRNFI